MDKILYALIAYCLIREIVYLYTVNKLVNKLMSRNYFEYSQAVGVKPEAKKVEFREEDFPEDLGSLQGIGVL